MQQRVHAADVHESSIIGQTADRSMHGRTDLDLGVPAIFPRAFFLFDDHSPVNH